MACRARSSVGTRRRRGREEHIEFPANVITLTGREPSGGLIYRHAHGRGHSTPTSRLSRHQRVIASGLPTADDSARTLVVARRAGPEGKRRKPGEGNQCTNRVSARPSPPLPARLPCLLALRPRLVGPAHMPKSVQVPVEFAGFGPGLCRGNTRRPKSGSARSFAETMAIAAFSGWKARPRRCRPKRRNGQNRVRCRGESESPAGRSGGAIASLSRRFVLSFDADGAAGDADPGRDHKVKSDVGFMRPDRSDAIAPCARCLPSDR
jgi:hypothetical protein